MDPLERVVTTTTSSLARDETTGTLVQTDFSKQPNFEPSFVGLEGKVLRFVSEMTDSVPESLSEPYPVAARQRRNQPAPSNRRQGSLFQKKSRASYTFFKHVLVIKGDEYTDQVQTVQK